MIAESPPACCAAALAQEAAALHPTDPVFASIQRTAGRPQLHPTDHGLPYRPCSLDCAPSIARASTRLQVPLEIGIPTDTPLITRRLDPEQPLELRPVRVAVLDLQREETDFAGSLELQFAAGDLARVGHRAELLRTTTGMTGARLDDAATETLVQGLTDAGFEVVALRDHVSDRFVEALRSAGIASLYLDSVAYRGRRPPDGIYDRVQAGDDRVGLIEAVDHFARTGALPPAPPLPGSGIDRVIPQSLLELAHYWPAVVSRDASTGEVRPMARHMLIHAYGCPWSADVADNPAYAGVPLPPEVKRAGCSYCAIGGDYRKLAVPDYIGFLAAQIAWLAEHAPGTEVVVSDEATFGFLDRLVERLVAAGTRPGPLLIKARMNGLLEILDRFEQTLILARDHSISVTVYLLGIENFSDAELLRYNKGIRSEQLVAGLRILLELEQRYPETFSATRYNAHGFILYNPWTTLADLQINRRWFRELQIRRLSGKAVWARLRMHRWQPLYALALRDGLVDHSDRFGRLIRREVGYHDQEQAWRFSDPGVELTYFLITRAMAAVPGADEVGLALFEAALDRALALAPSEPLPLEELQQQFDALRSAHGALFSGGPGERRVRDGLQRALAELGRRSERFRWTLEGLEPAGSGFVARFAGPGGARTGVVPVSGDSVAWEPARSKAEHLFGQLLDRVL